MHVEVRSVLYRTVVARHSRACIMAFMMPIEVQLACKETKKRQYYLVDLERSRFMPQNSSDVSLMQS